MNTILGNGNTPDPTATLNELKKTLKETGFPQVSTITII